MRPVIVMIERCIEDSAAEFLEPILKDMFMGLVAACFWAFPLCVLVDSLYILCLDRTFHDV